MKIKIQAKVDVRSLATVHNWLKSKGITVLNRSSLVNTSVSVLANTIVTNGFPSFDNEQEAMITLNNLGVTLTAPTAVMDEGAYKEALLSLEAEDGAD